MVVAKRGELWVLAAQGRLGSKPRPNLIIRSNLFSDSEFVTVLPLTSKNVESPTRVAIEASEHTGLNHRSYVMADKIQTTPLTNLKGKIGAISAASVTEVERTLLVYLGIPD